MDVHILLPLQQTEFVFLNQEEYNWKVLDWDMYAHGSVPKHEMVRLHLLYKNCIDFCLVISLHLWLLVFTGLDHLGLNVLWIHRAPGLT